MAWSASGGFRAFFADVLGNANSFWTPALPNLDLETHKVALFGNSVTPNYDATGLAATYNGTGSTFSAANEVSGTNYTAAGTALTSTTVSTVAGGIVMWDAADTSWASATFSNAYGCLVYADSVTAPTNNVDEAICAVYFGGAYQVTSGTFTIQWNANGLLQIDLA